MRRRLIEKGRTISAANETEIRAAVAALSAVLSRAFTNEDNTSNGDNGTVKTKEAAKIAPGKTPTLDDVRKSLQALIDLLSPEAKENLEGDGDGDNDPENVIIQGDDVAKTKEAGVSCSQCNAAVDRYDTFCGNCGARLAGISDEMHCVSCGGIVDEDDKFCPSCGAPVTTTQQEAGFPAGVKAPPFGHDATKDTKCPKCGKVVPAGKLACPSCGEKMTGAVDSAKESGTVPSLVEMIPLVEGGAVVDKNGCFDLKIIAPGWGSSGYYSPDVLKRDGPTVFTRETKMFWDHPTITEERDRPERSLKELAAVFVEDAHYSENHQKGPGLYTRARALQGFKPAITELAPYMGASIRAFGTGKSGTVNGKTGKVIESITDKASVDFVTVPGAGGQVVSLFEAARGGVVIKNEENEVDLREAEDKLREARNENARLRESIVIRDARDYARDSLSGADIPEMAKTRIAESLSMNPPVGDDGVLDKAKFQTKIKEAIADEAKYLSEVLGAGRVRGFGNSNGDSGHELSDKDFQTSLAAEFQRLGLSESNATIAARGR
jgi:RNA polymerase subunit RPABC4/transcription elongation factor Spt4